MPRASATCSDRRTTLLGAGAPAASPPLVPSTAVTDEQRLGRPVTPALDFASSHPLLADSLPAMAADRAAATRTSWLLSDVSGRL